MSTEFQPPELNDAQREIEALRRQLKDLGSFGELVGNSAPMREVYSLVEQVASSSASVLITGESGTGKELVARTIHQLSPRRNRAFIGINWNRSYSDTKRGLLPVRRRGGPVVLS